ncbi:MAG TPA: hypothetical protein VHP63_04285 [candidate division Zixibacteria bacterium]|nr:hypothetical protein [candidate division Zixibacteria bacterium]
MKTTLLLIGLICAAVSLSGCGSEMTIVQAKQKAAKEPAFATEVRWKNSYNAALAHYNKKEYSQALELYAVALKYSGEDDETRSWIYYSMGRCWEGLKDLAKAEQNYIMAQNLDPNLSEASDGLRRIIKLRAQSN